MAPLLFPTSFSLGAVTTITKVQVPAASCTNTLENAKHIQPTDNILKKIMPFINMIGGGVPRDSILFSHNQPPTPNPSTTFLSSNFTSRLDRSTNQPGHMLPLEILQQIIFYTMPPQTEWNLGTPWSLPKQTNAPLALRRVCKAWNEAALLQLLRGSIAWSIGVPRKPDSTARLAWIRLLSKLMEGVTLGSFSYEIGRVPLTLNSLGMIEVVSRLVANSRAVRIILPDWHPLDPYDTPTLQDPMVDVDMPHLRLLSWTSPHDIETTLPVEWGLPWTKLTEAPWEQLSTLFLTCPLTISCCVDVLGWGPRLQIVEFNGVSESGDPNANAGLTAPLLHALRSLKVCASTRLDQLFEDVKFPNLNYFHLHSSYCTGRIQNLGLTWSLLTTVVLECPMDLVDAYQLFQQCHAVTKIEWHWPSNSEIPLPRNELLRSCPLELPLLESLTITPSLPDFYVEPLVKLLVTQKTQILANFTAPFLPAKILRSEYLVALVLTSTPISISECLSVIAGSDNLQHLDVIILESNPTEILQTAISNLASLAIHTTLQNVQPLLGCLVLPSLTSLKISSQPHERGPVPTTMGSLDWTGIRNYSNGPQQRGILALLKRSKSDGAPLRNLILQDIDIEEEEVGHILKFSVDGKMEIDIKANVRPIKSSLLIFGSEPPLGSEIIGVSINNQVPLSTSNHNDSRQPNANRILVAFVSTKEAETVGPQQLPFKI
ncbi:hypothetical protein BDZ94DRAFT_1239557 [Collybia nuda]|uniref:F-box domain-containing protein n=1 Tax=Collybia nuda TaxID=64659 RepID=A0A9P6CB23_9AGAR|nr:hypothetical protein BDZ94DRAFT_1239557 [Collybia nuda]